MVLNPRRAAGVLLVLAGTCAGAQQPPEDAALYEIDVERSDLHWLVYRAGALSRFGHDHVISVGEMTGTVLLHPDLEHSRFELEIPVEGLVVDDPQLRALEGEEFASEPSAEDIAGTRRNMLSEAVLDAERHPVLRITGTGPVVKGGSESLEVTVEILGRSIPLTVPTTLRLDEETLEASGTFQLTHETLGMEPFSVMMGALQVAEELDFAYRVTARRAE